MQYFKISLLLNYLKIFGFVNLVDTGFFNLSTEDAHIIIQDDLIH